ncbi:MAG: hypothetical protein AB7P03_24400 [Kofleriaceae bacterium]
MYTGKARWLATLGALAACGGGSDGSIDADNGSILGPTPTLYTETGTSAYMAPEATGYTLDPAGIRISGTSASAGATDYFELARGTATRVDVQAFVNGTKQSEANSVAMIALDNAGDGYSALRGNGYFIRATIDTAATYVLSISIGPADASYTLEMRPSD